MIIRILSISFILALLFCEGCKKDDAPKPLTELDKLPPATQSGKNTFGCLVNGKAFVPSLITDVIAIYQQGILQMSGYRNSPGLSIGMDILEDHYGPLTTKSYPLNNYPDSSGGAAYLPSGANAFCDTNAFTGSITLTKLDRVNYIVSGTFEFVSAAIGCDTLKVTNGRFDIKYIP